MNNSFFVFSQNQQETVKIERSHICIWEFKNNTTLLEFGFEICSATLPTHNLILSLYIPWLEESKAEDDLDLYKKLNATENGRFIFNDSITESRTLDGGRNEAGIEYSFANRERLCILPVSISRASNNILDLTIDLQAYRTAHLNTNIYCRFSVTPKGTISMQKKGLSKSTIVYDIKVNERRNIPEGMANFFLQKNFCEINTCFCFFIIPNEYDIVFFENDSLKNVRTLEYEAFMRYLGDKRVKKDELIVVFNKKKGSESFSFFSIFTKERIGPGQYILAILINMVSGILLFLPSFRNELKQDISVWRQLPIELILAFLITIVTFLYFLWPKLRGKKKH